MPTHSPYLRPRASRADPEVGERRIVESSSEIVNGVPYQHVLTNVAT
jgi:hypothetical protein